MVTKTSADDVVFDALVVDLRLLDVGVDAVTSESTVFHLGVGVTQIELHVVRERVGEACMQCIGKAPRIIVLVTRVLRRYGEVLRVILDRQMRAADTGTDIRRDAVKGTKVRIGVSQQAQLGELRCLVGDPAGAGTAIEGSVEIGAEDIFQRRIDAEIPR